jgi:hypothetical protein
MDLKEKICKNFNLIQLNQDKLHGWRFPSRKLAFEFHERRRTFWLREPFSVSQGVGPMELWVSAIVNCGSKYKRYKFVGLRFQHIVKI